MRVSLGGLIGLVLACGGVGPVERDIAYDERFGDATRYDVHRPLGDGIRAGVLIIHGGGWFSFSKERYSQLAEQLAAEGYVVANTNYRLVPDGIWPVAAQDSRCALAHFRAHADAYGVDPNRIALVGYSAGGHLAGLLGVAPSLSELDGDCPAGSTGAPQAVVSGAGVMDLAQVGWAGQVQDFVGGTPEAIPETYARASPLTHVGAGAPPFLFIHGEQDVYVPIDQARRMREALRAVGTEAELLQLPGGGHNMNPGAGTGRIDWVEEAINGPEAFWAMRDFLRRQLGER